MTRKTFVNFLISFVFVFNICIFGPLELYYTNIMDIWFPIKLILPIIISFSIILFCFIFILLQRLQEKKRKIVAIIIGALTVALYIQGNFLNIGYQVLDGSEIEWKKLIIRGIINSIIWIILLIFPYCLLKKKDSLFYRYQSIISSGIFLIEVITLTIVIKSIDMQLVDANLSNKDFYLDQSNIYNLSDKENFIIFVSDTFEGTYMTELLEKYPDFKDKLSDFTYFDNTTSVATQTFESMPMIFTGEELQLGNNLQENLEYCFSNTNMYDILKENNYTSEIYTEPALIPISDKDVIDNKVNSQLLLSLKSKMHLSIKLYKLVLYRYMPLFLKKPFYMDSSEINNIDDSNIDRYELNDVKFYKILKDRGISNSYETNSFKIYHLNGIHQPYNIDKDISYNYSKDYLENVSEDERRMNQAYASIQILVEYIEMLKEKNLYDNTTILLLSDHGWNNRYYSTLLAKPENYRGEFKVSGAPISLLEDLKPTILNSITHTKDYGKDIWDYKENEARTRRVYNYTFTRGDNIYKVLLKIVLETNSKASDFDSYKIVSQEEINTDIDKTYKLGEKIDFVKSENIEYISTVGILKENIREVSKGFSTTNKCEISLKREKTNTDITVKLHIKDVFVKNQTIIISVNGIELYKDVLKKGKSSDISFKIPKEIWNSDKELKLNIELPDATFGNPKILGQETIYMGIWIESLVFNN